MSNAPEVPLSRAEEIKKQEFREYLEKTGVVDVMTQALVHLFDDEEGHGSNPIVHLKQQIAPEMATLKQENETLKSKNEELEAKVKLLESQVQELKEKLEKPTQ
eukprot:c10051_g1_i2.p1 GENE.c10051_g1_i2~~c10051_g1_i2.p1  ORF type:complete len:112 (+),score=38.56 c10051_g1_i2:25-336(+)